MAERSYGKVQHLNRFSENACGWTNFGSSHFHTHPQTCSESLGRKRAFECERQLHSSAQREMTDLRRCVDPEREPIANAV
jgi:hypothetical protein